MQLSLSRDMFFKLSIPYDPAIFELSHKQRSCSGVETELKNQRYFIGKKIDICFAKKQTNPVRCVSQEGKRYAVVFLQFQRCQNVPQVPLNLGLNRIYFKYTMGQFLRMNLSESKSCSELIRSRYHTDYSHMHTMF